MSSNPDFNPRMTISLRQDQINDLRYLLDWGIRSKIFEPIVDDLIEMLKKDKASTLALLLSREIHLDDFLKES